MYLADHHDHEILSFLEVERLHSLVISQNLAWCISIVSLVPC